MLITCSPLDSTFSNPVAACPSLSHSSPADSHHCYPPPDEQEWLAGCPIIPILLTSSTEALRDEGSQTSSPTEGLHIKRDGSQEDLLQIYPTDGFNFLKDCHAKDKTIPYKKAESIKPPAVKLAMNAIDPEDDLNCLINNERQLELCGYYYGSLSWLDASHLLRRCRVGTFLVRDSEHGSYLYTLSVQTRKGPTSCRIEYTDGSFQLDSSKDLSHKMPRFDCVTHLIDFYVQLPKYFPNTNSNKALAPVWLDMDEENTMDVPVQIYKPLYRQVSSLQHICRVNIVRNTKKNHPCKSRTIENPSVRLARTLELEDPQYKSLPNIIKDYLIQYPYSQ